MRMFRMIQRTYSFVEGHSKTSHDMAEVWVDVFLLFKIVFLYKQACP